MIFKDRISFTCKTLSMRLVMSMKQSNGTVRVVMTLLTGDSASSVGEYASVGRPQCHQNAVGALSVCSLEVTSWRPGVRRQCWRWSSICVLRRQPWLWPDEHSEDFWILVYQVCTNLVCLQILDSLKLSDLQIYHAVKLKFHWARFLLVTGYFWPGS